MRYLNEVEETKTLDNFNFDELLGKIDFKKLYGLGGAFLISPLSESKTFSKEMFSEDQKMFADAAYDYATKRMRPVKDQLQKLNKELTLEIFKELGEMGFLGVDIMKNMVGLILIKLQLQLLLII